jgi:uncharacterized protein YukE
VPVSLEVGTVAIELPSEVAFFLNVMGVPYPDVNEDDVRALAQHVRTFSDSVASTHAAATGTIKELGSAWSGESYEALVAAWARMSATNMADLDQACKVLATALSVAADVITAVKVAVLAELAALAASYAVVLVTPGAGAFTVAVREVTRRLCNGMEEMLLGYIAAEVISKAIEPLEDTINRFINGTVYDAAQHALGVPPMGGNPQPLYIEPDEVVHYANMLDDLADDILKHAETFADNVAHLDFGSSSRFEITDGPAGQRQFPSPVTSQGFKGPFPPDVHNLPIRSIEPEETNFLTGVTADVSPAPGFVDRQPSDEHVPAAMASADHPGISGANTLPPATPSPTHAASSATAQAGMGSIDAPDTSVRPDSRYVDGAFDLTANGSEGRFHPIAESAQHGPTYTTNPVNADGHSRSSYGFGLDPRIDSDQRGPGSTTNPVDADSRSSDHRVLGSDSQTQSSPGSTAPPPRPGNTPWARSAPKAASRKTRPRAVETQAIEAAAVPAADSREKLVTPWSKTARKPDARTPGETKVFAPPTSDYAPTSRDSRATSAAKAEKEEADKAELKSNPAHTESAPRVAVIPPQIESPPEHRAQP